LKQLGYLGQSVNKKELIPFENFSYLANTKFLTLSQLSNLGYEIYGDSKVNNSKHNAL